MGDWTRFQQQARYDQLKIVINSLKAKVNSDDKWKDLYFDLYPYNNIDEENHFFYNTIISSQIKENNFNKATVKIVTDSFQVMDESINMYIEKNFYLNWLKLKKNNKDKTNLVSRFWEDFKSLAVYTR